MQFDSEVDFEKEFDVNLFSKRKIESIFSEKRVGFLTELSRAILKSPRAKQFPDLITFAYYCRKSNLKKLKSSYIGNLDYVRKFGLGLCLHIAPANIPMNFAFTFLMGFLSGNNNIVRIPTKKFEQVELFLELYYGVCDSPKFHDIGETNIFIRTVRDSDNLKKLISNVDALCVWGGNSTVQNFRTYNKKPRCVEVNFPDRVSSTIIDCKTLIELDKKEQFSFCRDFFNDSYLVDQNACSSPSIIFWYGSKVDQGLASTRFSEMMNEYLNENYELAPISRIDKLIDLITFCKESNGSIDLTRTSNKLWFLENSSFNINPKLGSFISKGITDLASVGDFLRPNEQSLMYLGFDPKFLLERLLTKGVLVDRIVPVGQALNIGINWDGKDMIETLSRQVELI